MTPPTPPVSPPSSPAWACIELARSTTTRFALEDGLSSFATAAAEVKLVKLMPPDDAGEVIDLSSDSSQSEVEMVSNPTPNLEVQLALPSSHHPPMPHSGRFEDIVDLVPPPHYSPIPALLWAS